MTALTVLPYGNILSCNTRRCKRRPVIRVDKVCCGYTVVLFKRRSLCPYNALFKYFPIGLKPPAEFTVKAVCGVCIRLKAGGKALGHKTVRKAFHKIAGQVFLTYFKKNCRVLGNTQLICGNIDLLCENSALFLGLLRLAVCIDCRNFAAHTVQEVNFLFC